MSQNGAARRPSTATTLPAIRSDGQLIVRCPFCGSRHVHGAGGGNGLRAAHCGGHSYVIQEVVGRVLWLMA
jgi:hypothetical protein